MIDLDRVESFEWDGGNRCKNQRHGVTDGEAEQVFLTEPLFVSPDLAHSSSENRFHALGQTFDGRLLHVTFTLRHDGRRLRVISARDMHRKERSTYEAKAKEGP